MTLEKERCNSAIRMRNCTATDQRPLYLLAMGAKYMHDIHDAQGDAASYTGSAKSFYRIVITIERPLGIPSGIETIDRLELFVGTEVRLCW